MLPIGAGAGSVSRQTQQVSRAFDRLADTSVKLATLKRVNQGSDDPAALIAATELNRELTALEEASAATERTRALVHVADSGLGQAGDLLNQIEGNLVTAASDATSSEERAAIQIEIDAAIDALDRIGRQHAFRGKKSFHGRGGNGPNRARPWRHHRARYTGFVRHLVGRQFGNARGFAIERCCDR